MQRRAELALWLIVILWGSTFVIVKSTLDAVAPFALIAARFWVGGLTLAAGVGIAQVWTRRRPAPADSRLWRDGVLTGLVLTCGFATQTIGLQTTAAGKTSFITGLNVALVPLLGVLLFRQRASLLAAGGVILAVVGMGLMTLDASLTLAPGDLWVMACAVCFALHIVITARFAPRHSVAAFTLIQLFTVAILMTLAQRIGTGAYPTLPRVALPAILYLGMAATALIFGLQTWAQRYASPTHTALIFALEPVFAALFAWAFAGETLELREWLGGALIVLGMVIAEWKPASRLCEPATVA